MDDQRCESSIRPRTLLFSLVAAALVLGVLLSRFDWTPPPDPPGGAIGYHSADGDGWVNAQGDEVAPPDPSEVLSVPAIRGSGWIGEFPSPDGLAVAFVANGPAGMTLHTIDNGVVRTVAKLSDDASPPLVNGGKAAVIGTDGVPLIVAWSPDGRTLAWGSVTEPPYTLGLASRRGGQVRTFPLQGGYVGELQWSPDSRYLAISTYADNRADHTVLVLDNGSNDPVRQLAKGCVMVWSPDSDFLALHGEPTTQPGLWIVSVDGDAEQIIDRLGVAPFAWVPE